MQSTISHEILSLITCQRRQAFLCIVVKDSGMADTSKQLRGDAHQMVEIEECQVGKRNALSDGLSQSQSSVQYILSNDLVLRF